MPAPAKATGTCALTANQVVINEIMPRPADTVEWVELYNKTDTVLDIGNCYIDDVADTGGSPIQIAAGTTIPAHGFWVTLDMSTYINNDGDYVRLLSDDATTVLDSYQFGASSVGSSWYRNPDGGDWSATATSSPTKGFTNIDTCGDGSWKSGLEIHHINVGQGDATLIVSPAGKPAATALQQTGRR